MNNTPLQYIYRVQRKFRSLKKEVDEAVQAKKDSEVATQFQKMLVKYADFN